MLGASTMRPPGLLLSSPSGTAFGGSDTRALRCRNSPFTNPGTPKSGGRIFSKIASARLLQNGANREASGLDVEGIDLESQPSNISPPSLQRGIDTRLTKIHQSDQFSGRWLVVFQDLPLITTTQHTDGGAKERSFRIEREGNFYLLRRQIRPLHKRSAIMADRWITEPWRILDRSPLGDFQLRGGGKFLADSYTWRWTLRLRESYVSLGHHI
ncbi:hypothetical protein HOY80DRAFT_531723 [Tuber brumale]|nr:hypothetical protein HOY80DRAFT_531723 [Tuber brumale]